MCVLPVCIVTSTAIVIETSISSLRIFDTVFVVVSNNVVFKQCPIMFFVYSRRVIRYESGGKETKIGIPIR